MRAMRLGYSALVTLVVASAVYGQAGPSVSNVVATQMPGAQKRIQITYNLTDPDSSQVTVWVLAGRVVNGAVPIWDIPVISTTGDVGPNIAPGTATKTIIWDAAADVPGAAGNFRVRVYADDANGMANMVFVPQDPQHQLEGFWIDKYEVTNQRYCEFLNAGGHDSNWDSQQEITKNGSIYTVFAGRANYPVRFVSYDDATAFATWLSQREGRLYRIPTPEEWYKAAAWDPAALKDWRYGFRSDSIDCDRCVYSGCPGPQEVGSRGTTSSYGCYDLSGNVWEFTTEQSGNDRNLRGGSWVMDESYCRCTARSGFVAPSLRYFTYGFRLVLNLNR